MAFNKEESSGFEKISFPEENKNKILIIILSVVVIATIIILYFGFWKPSDSGDNLTTEDPAIKEDGSFSTSTVESISNTEKDINSITFKGIFLETEIFDDLREHGVWPVQVDEKGRNNPFLPYSGNSNQNEGNSLGEDEENKENESSENNQETD